MRLLVPSLVLTLCAACDPEPTPPAPTPQAPTPTTPSPTAQGPTARGPTARGPTAQGPTAQGPTEQGPAGAWQLQLVWPLDSPPRSAWGELTLERTEAGWRGHLRFERLFGAMSCSLKDVEVLDDRIAFALDDAGVSMSFQGTPYRGRWSGQCTLDGEGPFAWGAARDELASARRATAPRVEGIPHEALQALLDAAVATNTDALFITRDGAVVLDETFGNEPAALETMSATKSVVSLAVGHLIEAGKIPSLDTPVAHFYPEWKSGSRARVTVRHLLNHTSGMQAKRTTEEIYASPDVVQLALGTELKTDPGEAFFYNNRAVNLIAGLVEKASGQPLDEYLREHVFAPLGIREFRWRKDALGHPHAMAGLRIAARDLARIGQLMLDEGRHEDVQIISKDWIAASTRASQKHQPRCGLLWWLIPAWTEVVIDADVLQAWRRADVDSETIDKLVPLADRTFGREELSAAIGEALGGPELAQAWEENLSSRGLPAGREVLGPTVGFCASGYRGQFLVVLPQRRIVAVRQIDSRCYRTEVDSFRDFIRLVRDL